MWKIGRTWCASFPKI
ncbi:hypothetical protein [Micromonospora sp. RP3T]